MLEDVFKSYPILRSDLQHALDEEHDLMRDVLVVHFPPIDVIHQLIRLLPREGSLASHQLVEDDAQRPYVDCFPDGVSEPGLGEPFGGHVVDGAAQRGVRLVLSGDQFEVIEVDVI